MAGCSRRSGGSRGSRVAGAEGATGQEGQAAGLSCRAAAEPTMAQLGWQPTISRSHPS